MAVFRYMAIPLGSTDAVMRRSGEIGGASAAEARASLRRMGLQVIEIRQVGAGSRGRHLAPAWWPGLLRRRRRPVVADMQDSLATMLESGLPLLECLETLSSTVPGRSGALRGLLAHLREEVRGGRSLGEAMRVHPSWFGPEEVALIESGQRSGKLAGTLRELASEHQRRDDLAARLAQALAYPSCVAVVGLAVLVFLSERTLPDLVSILSDASVEVPALTSLVISVGSWLGSAGPVAAVLLVAVLLLAPFARRLAGRLELPWPTAAPSRLLPQVMRRMAVARLSRGLAALLHAGVPLVEALRTMAPATSYEDLRACVLRAADRVERGDPLADALTDEAWFDVEFRRLLGITHVSGELDAMLQRLSERYERRASRQIDRLTSLLEPAVILCLAVAIGVVVMAAILPMVRLKEAL
jgi:type II secretory pathway component PulF